MTNHPQSELYKTMLAASVNYSLGVYDQHLFHAVAE